MVSTLIGMRFPRGTNQQVRKSIPFQRFLIALSVRPGMSFAISVQRDPSVAYARKMTVSSCSVHASWRMAGSSWLHLMREVIRGHQRSSRGNHLRCLHLMGEVLRAQSVSNHNYIQSVSNQHAITNGQVKFNQHAITNGQVKFGCTIAVGTACQSGRRPAQHSARFDRSARCHQWHSAALSGTQRH